MAKAAQLTSSSAFSAITSEVNLNWTTQALYNMTDNVWASSPNPDRLTIPAELDGMTGEIILQVGHSTYVGGGVDAQYRIVGNNGSAFEVRRFAASNLRTYSVCLTSGPRLLTSGDFYELRGFASATSHTPLNTETSFSVVTSEDRLGFVLATPTSATTPTTETALVWDTPYVDTRSTHNGTTGFVVPSDASGMLVHLSNRGPTFDTGQSIWRLKVNGTTVHTFNDDGINTLQGYSGGPGCWGLHFVNPSDVITVTLVANSAGGTTSGTSTALTIEWI